jgi:hypothetical protein
MPNLTVEEALRQIEDRAAMLRFLADSIRRVDVLPEPAFFSGLADALGEMETIARTARRSLDVQALDTQLKRRAAGIESLDA